jgi:hypothetical protein
MEMARYTGDSRSCLRHKREIVHLTLFWKVIPTKLGTGMLIEVVYHVMHLVWLIKYEVFVNLEKCVKSSPGGDGKAMVAGCQSSL